ncbi:MAG TPA: hypothetical protein VGF92_22445 [Stellaceae bacterium]|jgi:hypothetical protein
MKSSFVTGALAAAFFLAALSTAQAEFFSLSGRFQCLESGAAVCGDAQSVVLPQAPPPAVADAAASASDEAPPAAAAAPSAAAGAAPAAVETRPVDRLTAVAARVQARRPSSNDIVWLTQAAHEGNARAIELLAWCSLNAIGMLRDPVEAFLLYGAAGDGALPNARENQRLIFERDLDSHQRQQVLDLANEGVTLASLIPSIR